MPLFQCPPTIAGGNSSHPSSNHASSSHASSNHASSNHASSRGPKLGRNRLLGGDRSLSLLSPDDLSNLSPDGLSSSRDLNLPQLPLCPSGMEAQMRTRSVT